MEDYEQEQDQGTVEQDSSYRPDYSSERPHWLRKHYYQYRGRWFGPIAGRYTAAMDLVRNLRADVDPVHTGESNPAWCGRSGSNTNRGDLSGLQSLRGPEDRNKQDGQSSTSISRQKFV